MAKRKQTFDVTRAASAVKLPAMFDDVAWCGPLALEHTLRALRRCGLSVELGAQWFDVDEPADLKRLAASPDLPPRTAAWLARHRTLLYPEGEGL